MDPFNLKEWDATLKGIINEVVIDSSQVSKSNTLFVALEGSQTDGHAFVQDAAKRGAKYALVKKGFSLSAPTITLIPVEDTLKALQSLAASYRSKKSCQVVAIIGTHGKTLTKDLLIRLLTPSFSVAASPESFNSQIGVPLSLFKICDHHSIALIEAAVSKPSEMRALASMIKPQAAILTHIGEKHTTTLPTRSSHIQEFATMIQDLPPSGWALLPEPVSCDTKASLIFAEEKGRLPFVSCSPLASKMAIKVYFPDGTLFETQPQQGSSYLASVMNMGVKAAYLLGASYEAICQTLPTFRLAPRKKELWKTPQGALLVNDSDCQDPLSFKRALKEFEYLALNHRKIIVSDDTTITTPSERHTFSSQEKALSYLKETLQPNDAILFKGKKKISLDTLFSIFHDSIPNNQLQINLSVVKDNIEKLKSKLPKNTTVMPMVKAFAYGTDSILLSKFLAGQKITHLGVSQVEEGVALRRAGIKQEIFTFHAAPFEAKKAVVWNLQVAVSDIKQIDALSFHAEKEDKQLKVHLHIDTGMRRLGCQPSQALFLAKRIKEDPFLILEGVMTHFAAAEDPFHDLFTKEQIATFDACIALIEGEGIDLPYKHAANSAAANRFHLPQYNMVRVALTLFNKAVSLHSKIVGFNICSKGESVGYGRHYLATREQEKIACIPLGYNDGIQRSFSEKGSVLIRGKKAPMIGKVNMDFMMVDVTDIPDAEVGDPVLIFGEDLLGYSIAPQIFARELDSIAHEILSCIGPRIQRIFIDET